MNDPRGSVWHKWDLHVHTPCSLQHTYYGSTQEEQWERFLNDIENLPPEFKVLGINDYLFLDGYKRILAEKRNGRLTNIELLLPVLELRLDKFGGTDSHLSRVNWHVIFSNELEPGIIESQFINHLQTQYQLSPRYTHEPIEWAGLITRESLRDLGQKIIDSVPPEKKQDFGSPLHEGFNALNISLDRIREALNKDYFKGKYLTAVGKTEWYDIKWNDQSIADKKTIINSADFVFISSETSSNFRKAKASLTNARVHDLLLDCSDAHANSDYPEKDRIGNSLTWIKADLTFEGLKQVLHEPQGRLFVGREPEVFERVRNNKTKYISALTFKKDPDSGLAEKWFEGNSPIPFNPELVAIIGNKGSGKSALSDTIGLLGNSRQQIHFSFLHRDKFCDPKDSKAKHFSAELKWADEFAQEMKLSDQVASGTEIEMVAYKPQNYLERICSDEVEGTEFNKELKTVIFSHVEEADRLGCSSLDELITAKTEEKKAAIEIVKKAIHKVNAQIVRAEAILHPNYRRELENKLKLKRAEKKGMEEPVEVKKPDTTDPIRKAAIEEINAKIAKLQDEINAHEAKIETLQAGKSDLTRRINDSNTLLQKLANFQQQFTAFQSECELLCSHLKIDFEQIAKLELKTGDIDTIKADAVAHLTDISDQLDEENEKGPVYRSHQAKVQMEESKAALDQDNKNYQQYLKDLQEWKKRCAAIDGSATNPEEGTIRCYEALLKKMEADIPNQLQGLKTQRSEKVHDIFKRLDELRKDYELLYASVKEFMKHAPFADPDRFLLDFRVSIQQKGFPRRFFDYIGQNKRGSFYGAEQGRTRLRGMLDTADFDTHDGLSTFLHSLERSLITDEREDGRGEDRHTVEQLRGEDSIVDFYDYLYCLDYLEPEYSLQCSGKGLHQLSPGERGLVLLIFYLFIDKKDIPLVLDQPEENLDNESIYKVLVACIRQAKQKRQIIIVTHNPNLAVVCDAEQIIYSEIDKQNGNQITYTCGGIENPTINKKLIDVLEGTRPAFDNRDNKYYVTGD